MKSLFILMICSLVLSSCQPRMSARLQGTASDGLSYRWTDRTLSVCWENPSDETAAMQKLVQDIVEKEYGRAGFTFFGWMACSEKSSGIRIVIADTSDRHVLAFGARLDGMKNGMQLNLQFKAIDFYGCTGTGVSLCVQVDALHEFGHALGLRHEQSRIDSSCANDEAMGLGESGALPLTVYDRDSIMSYCANDMLVLIGSPSPRLSETDVETLRLYYESHQSVGSEACKADGNRWIERDLESCCELQNDQILPYRSRPYTYCTKDYQIQLTQLDEKQLEAFLGASYDSMKHATDEDLDGPWLKVQMACHYENFRAFAWDQKIEGKALNEFISTRNFVVALRPAADLVCDGISIARPEVDSNYLRSRVSWTPDYKVKKEFDGEFMASRDPAYQNFPAKLVSIQLPTLPFVPQSIILQCDHNSYIGYPLEAESTLLWLGISFNANDTNKLSLHCDGLRAYNTELPRDASAVYTFDDFSREILLNQVWESITVELNADGQTGGRRQKPQMP